jgi:hypothetical protein
MRAGAILKRVAPAFLLGWNRPVHGVKRRRK